MKVSKSTQNHEVWLAYAEDDLKIAKIILRSPDISVVGVLFHAQQCAEKALKAFLVYNQRKFRKIHDLVELVNMCVDIHSDFSSLTELIHELNPYATEIRYPESFSPTFMSPWQKMRSYVRNKFWNLQNQQSHPILSQRSKEGISLNASSKPKNKTLVTMPLHRN